MLVVAGAMLMPGSRVAAQRAPSGWVGCVMVDASCTPPPVAREFRGVWVASVANIDWPSRAGLPVAAAKRELLTLLDRARATGLNAVILQVRPAADALYASRLEPWSEYLTGRQGRAPSPRWDPLAFAVEEAHRRGLELHAWFNPYRARHPSAKGLQARSHVSRAAPSMVRRYGGHLWMDPGDPAVRAHTRGVVLDVVRRYDVDGVHLDDYFYPYAERDSAGEIDFPDSTTYATYLAAGGGLARADWRRANVDSLVRELHEGIHVVKPWVKFGVSPFGIWRPGYPASITGFDAHDRLFANARLWLTKGWVDYFTPQLYWPVDQVPQSYPVLLQWWAEQNAEARHLWPGNFTSRVGDRGRTPWAASEIERQVALTRASAGAGGNVHFSMKVFLEGRDSIDARLARDEYARIALVPASPWLSDAMIGVPAVSVRAAADGAVILRISPARGALPRWWLVQGRDRRGRWNEALIPGAQLTHRLAPGTDRAVVRGIDRAGVEGAIVPLRRRR